MASASPTPAPASKSFEELTSWLQERMTDLDVPGAAVGVFHHDEVHTAGLGVTKAGTEDSFTTSTRFGIASLTKIFTATALASLAQDGAVNLDDTVSQHLPGFRLSDLEATEAVTLGHLLSHAGGWADVLEPVPGQDSLAWYATQMGDLEQIIPVGSHFSYSNSGFMLAGAVQEAVTDVTYEHVISESILQPLGMKYTGFETNAERSSNRAHGHQIANGKLEAIPRPDVPRAVNPAAGLLSTVDDMLMFIRAHTCADSNHINPDALASMRRPLNSGGTVGPVVVDHIGTGWMLLDIDGETVLMSQGGDSGQISAMIAVPARQFGLVIFANSDSAMMLVNEAILRGMSAFTGLTLPEPESHVLTTEEAANAAGQFGLPEWLTFTITPKDESLQLATSAGGEEVPDLSGLFTMTAPTRGFKPHLGGRLWLDLVLDDTGTIQWLRFAGRLVPRIG